MSGFPGSAALVTALDYLGDSGGNARASHPYVNSRKRKAAFEKKAAC